MTFEMDFQEGETEQELRGSRPPNGDYHFAITDKKEGDTGNGFELTLEICDGEHPHQAGKKIHDWFSYPSDSHKDQGKFAGRRLKVLAKASGLVPRDHVGPAKIEWDDIIGAQLIATVQLVKEKGEDGKEYEKCKIKGCEMYHVDDEAKASVPKNREFLALLAEPTASQLFPQNGATATAGQPAAVGANDDLGSL